MRKVGLKLGIALVSIPVVAHAGAIDLLDANLRSAITGAVETLQTTAILWLSSFVLIQFVITNIGLLKSGSDIEAVFAKFLGSMFWFGFCFYVLLNGAEFIDKVSNGFITKAGEISGAGSFDAAAIISQGANLAGNLLGKINSASGITDLFLPSLLGGLLGIVIVAIAAWIGFKVFLIKLESMLIIMLAPLSFSFLGLNALKDQGIAPFKSLISLIYRILFLALILKTMGGMSDNLVAVIDQITEDSIEGIWSTVFAAVTGYALLGFLAYKSDSLAASLASGSTNMGTADVASAAALGAATGAALATGGAATANAAGKASQPMSDVMRMLTGGAGEIKNAAGSGSGGGSPIGQAPSRPPALSTTGPSNKNGMPLRPEPALESESAPSATQEASSTVSPEHGSSGSGATAGISGTGNSGLEKQVGDLVKAMSQPKAPSLKDRLGEVNRQVAQESASTHVSINTHHAD